MQENEQNYPLMSGWQEQIDKLNSTPEGKVIARDQGFREFYWMSSDEMTVIHESVLDGTFNFENITPALARSIYYSHPSIISMKDRPEVLELAAVGTLKEIEELKSDGNTTKAILRTRRLASILEELSVVTEGEESEKYEFQALSLNQEVSESSLYLPASPRKLHSIFAPYDIYFRRNADLLGHSSYQEEQAAYYCELADAVAETRLHEYRHGDASHEAVSGSFSEKTVLARIRDLIADSGRINELEVSQSFIRQDHTNHENLQKPVRWKWAFDLSLKNRESGAITPIEVKKRSRGSELTSNIAEYLPTIKIILIRLGWNTNQYLRIIEDYSRGRHNEIIGIKRTKNQQDAIDLFTSKVDEELQVLLDAA